MSAVTEPPPLARTEYARWPDALRTAWALLSPADERLMLRARLRWRGFTNPGATPPKAPLRRTDLNHVTALLWEQERAYRATSACRGGDGNVTLNSSVPRAQGMCQELTAMDVLALLRVNHAGLTLTEINDHLPTVGRVTLRGWLGTLAEHGQAHSRTMGGITLYHATREYRP